MVAFGKCTGGGRRAAKRVSTPLLAVLTTRSRSFSAVLVDVSATGARLRGDELPAVGEDLVLGVEQVRAFGSVKWHRDGDCGIEFDEPLPQAQVVNLRGEVARAAGLPPELRAAMEDWVLGVAR